MPGAGRVGGEVTDITFRLEGVTLFYFNTAMARQRRPRLIRKPCQRLEGCGGIRWRASNLPVMHPVHGCAGKALSFPCLLVTKLHTLFIAGLHVYMAQPWPLPPRYGHGGRGQGGLEQGLVGSWVRDPAPLCGIGPSSFCACGILPCPCPVGWARRPCGIGPPLCGMGRSLGQSLQDL